MSNEQNQTAEFERMQRYCLQLQIENAQLKLQILDLRAQQRAPDEIKTAE